MNRPYLNKTGFNKLAQSIKDYINRKITGYTKLGTASTKDYTTYVSPTQTEQLPISSSVYSAMTNMLRGAYHPAGSKTIAELTSDLLVKANLGNVYKITEDGVTSDLFIGGAGQTIKTGDNAIVLYASEDTYKFSLESGVVDLDAYQKKELTQAIEGANTVEDALSALSNGLNTKTNGVPYVTGENYSSTNLNEYLIPCITFLAPISNYSNIPSSISSVAYMLEVQATGNQGSTKLSYVSQILTAYDKSEKFIRSRNPNSNTWSSWQKLVTAADLTSSVTEGSTAPITSGGVYNALNNVTFHKTLPQPTTKFNFTSAVVQSNTSIMADVVIHAVSNNNVEMFYKGILKVAYYPQKSTSATLSDIVSSGLTPTISISNNIITIEVSSIELIYTEVFFVLHYYKRQNSLSFT